MSHSPRLPVTLLVGWAGTDGARLHPLLDAGVLPHLAGVVGEGVSGPLLGLPPLDAAPLETSVATGTRAFRHGILANAEPDPDTGEPRPATAAGRRVPTIWERLAAAGRCAHAVGWPGSHPAPTSGLAHGGVVVSEAFSKPTAPPGPEPWPLGRGMVSDSALAEALGGLRVRPEEVDGALLGEFVPRWPEVDQTGDDRLARLALALAECLSVHAAATFLLEHRRPEFLAVHYGFLTRLFPWASACERPLPPGVGERHGALYDGVLDAAARWLDRLLGRLLALAGEGSTAFVVSPGGWRRRAGNVPLVADQFPPEVDAAACRHPAGFFAARGPGLAHDRLVHGLSVLDVTPTLLVLAGVPATGLDGRVPPELFEGAPPAPTLLTAAEVPVPAVTPLTLEEGRAWAEQWTLGGETFSPDAAALRRERDWNLAHALRGGGRHAEAVVLLETLYREEPENPTVAFALVDCRLHLGRLAAARGAAETVFDHAWGTPAAEALRGHFAFCEQRFGEARMHFEKAVTMDGPRAESMDNLLGLSLLRLHHFPEAQAVFERTLARDPDDADAHLGRAHALLRRGRFAEAAASSRASLGRRHDQPWAHLNLGLALAKTGDLPGAIGALERCLAMAPDHVHARRALAALQRRRVDRTVPLPGGQTLNALSTTSR